jgi:hypothetical protein
MASTRGNATILGDFYIKVWSYLSEDIHTPVVSDDP